MMLSSGLADLIADVVLARGTAPATRVVMRRSVWLDIVGEQKLPSEKLDGYTLGGVPVDIDETLPSFPGFAVHREKR